MCGCRRPADIKPALDEIFEQESGSFELQTTRLTRYQFKVLVALAKLGGRNVYSEMSPAFDHYELWRDGKFLANVTNEVPNGLSYRVARYEDLGLPKHSRHEYRIRKVWKDGRKDPFGEPFYGLTR